MSICYIDIGRECETDVTSISMNGAVIKRWLRFVVNKMSMRKEAPEQQRAFYHSKEWQKCRANYISFVGGLCERCEAKGIIKPGYIVHHKDYITADNITDPEVLLDFNNLEYLCMDCHNAEHFKGRKRYKVDEFGRVTCPPVCDR